MLFSFDNDAQKPRGNPRSSGYARAPDGFYTEPVAATAALLAVESFPGGVHDPACGGGNVLQACAQRGIPAVGTDIVQRGPASQVADFFSVKTPLAPHIICNPPFSLAAEFALLALSLAAGNVAILQRTAWLEGARRHRSLFAPGHLHRV